MNTPLITAIIPVFNGEKYLTDAINSVADQTYSNIEIIVVDDGSTDSSAEIAACHPAKPRILRQNNQGAAAARNAGINEALGSFIGFLDSDDLWTEKKCEIQMNLFASDKNLECVFGLVQQFICPFMAPEEAKKMICPVAPMAGYLPSTILARVELFERIGYFDESHKVAEFIDWWDRALLSGVSSVCADTVFLKRRIHGQNMGITNKTDRRDYVSVARKAMLRRRF